MFYAREKELSHLNEKLNNNRFESILLYGRRRIGKTELIHQAAKSFDGTYIYYECKKSLIGDNIQGLTELLDTIYNIPYSFHTFKDILVYIFEKAKDEKILFVIDEFPFLINEQPTIISDLRDVIDLYKGNTVMKLIISGSYVDTMKGLNDVNSETYGRFTDIIPLATFDYYDSSLFYPNYSDEDKILMYSVFGGVAFFNSLIDPELSAIENIKKLIIQKNSILQLEVEHTITSETNKIPLMNSVISLLSRGVVKYTDIKQQLSSSKGSNVNPDYIIKKLIDLELIKKVVPINDQNNKKKITYQFNDHLLDFYYRYIYRYKNANMIMNEDDFYHEIIEKDLYEKYIPKQFEGISMEYLIRASQNHLLDHIILDIGSYSYDDPKKKVNRQFDVVTLDTQGYISYECKYTNGGIDQSIINEEEFQIKESGINIYKLGFISKNGFSPDIDSSKYNLIELKQFYHF